MQTLQAFKYLLNIDWKENFPEYVMKTDDDVYLNLPFLSSILFNDTKPKEDKETKPLLQGFLFITAPMLVEVNSQISVCRLLMNQNKLANWTAAVCLEYVQCYSHHHHFLNHLHLYIMYMVQGAIQM